MAWAEVMRCHRLGTKHEVIDPALRAAASEPLEIDKAWHIARRSHDVILFGASVWIEFLRGTRSAACNRFEAALESQIPVSGTVRVAVLAGAWDKRCRQSQRGFHAPSVLCERACPEVQNFRVHGHGQVTNGVGDLKGFNCLTNHKASER